MKKEEQKARIELLLLIEKELSKKPMSRKEVMAKLGKGKTCIIESLAMLKKQKRIHIYEYGIDGHRKTPIYDVGDYPDAVYKPLTSSIRQAEYRAKKKGYWSIKIKKTKDEINHHELINWVFKCQSLSTIGSGSQYLTNQVTSQQN